MSEIGGDALDLAEALDELASFLAAHNEPGWAVWVGQDAQRVRRGDGYGVTHFLSAFGGMGGLNDVVFDPINGNAIAGEGAILNERFQQLRGTAWEQATALRHEAE